MWSTNLKKIYTITKCGLGFRKFHNFINLGHKKGDQKFEKIAKIQQGLRLNGLNPNGLHYCVLYKIVILL